MKFTACSLNIKFDSEDDAPHFWDHRLPVIAEIIHYHRPDILGSQEGRRPQIMELEGSLKNYQGLHQHRQWIEERMYPTLFSTQSWQRTDSGDIWLSSTPDMAGSTAFNSAFPRLCTWSVIHHPLQKKDMLVANVHLDHILESTRQAQAEVMCRELSKMRTKKLPFILLGDFNEGPEGEVRKIIQALLPELIDPWQKLGLKEMGSHHKFTGNHSGNKRIDWILCNQSFQCQNIFLIEEKRNNHWPSDHFPVMATFVLN